MYIATVVRLRIKLLDAFVEKKVTVFDPFNTEATGTLHLGRFAGGARFCMLKNHRRVYDHRVTRGRGQAVGSASVYAVTLAILCEDLVLDTFFERA